MRALFIYLLAALAVGAAGQPLPCPRECECFFNTEALLQADCSARELYYVPEGLDPQTQILDLSDNLFETIPPQISEITYLEILNFSGNQIKTLSGNSLTNLTSLDILDLSSNKISNWGDISPNTLLVPAINLRILKLSRNPLAYFANLKNTELLVSENLHTLELNDCGITSIHGRSPVSKLPELLHLSLAHNPIKRFQKFASPSLRSLDLSYCELTFIGHDELNLLPSLTHLTMAHNYHLVLNKIDYLKSLSLKTIDISHCNMNIVNLSGLPNLEEANLRSNMIVHLTAQEFVNNSLLATLDLSSNHMGIIHKNAFEGLTSLRYLNLSFNVIPAISLNTFMRTPNLSVLNLHRNFFSRVGNFNSLSLKSIDMSSCEIEFFESNAFEGLPSLTEINLSKNLISHVPEFLSSDSLQHLDLSFNRLSLITNNTFSSLPRLTTLLLSENRFTETWKASYFANNVNLTEISLKDNTWRCECFESDMKSLYEYLTSDPPKIWDINSHLLCHSPSNVSGKNWWEACYFAWNPEAPSLNQNQRVLSFVLVIFAGFFVTCFIIMLVRRGLRMRLKAVQEERERDAEQARERLREMRMRREQEQQRNAPDPRDLVPPPSYTEALLMPKLDGSFHSLAGVGLGGDNERRKKRKPRRRTRSSGDLYDDDRIPQKLRSRRKSRAEHPPPPETVAPTEHDELMSRSEGNLPEACVTQILDLSDNLFETIPPQISEITNLEILNFSGNQIKTLSGNSLTNLTSLDILDLSSNKISNWGDISPNTLLVPAINLRILKLSRNPLAYFANLKNTELLVSENLHTLELNNCGIKGIHGRSPVSRLPELQHLSLAHNPIKRIQKLASPSLRFLDLSYCKLTFIDHDELNLLPSLIHLTMAHNYRLALNKIDYLKSLSLKTIDISHCNMNTVNLSGFPNLEEANLRSNTITHLTAQEFVNNSLLATLDLSSNHVGTIHKNAFEGLTSLRYLNLSFNVIPEISLNTFMRTPNLSVLNLHRNFFSRVGNFNSLSLKSIDMSFCEIQFFESNAFQGLPSLTEINLSKNLISHVPEFVSSDSLQNLDLSFNRLSLITKNTFSSLPRLTTLLLSENRFTETWKASYFANNLNLTEISLKDNTWRCDCFEGDMKSLYEYLTSDPPKIRDINSHLLCHSPSIFSGKNWWEACYFAWNPEAPSPNQNQRVLSFVLVIFLAGFFVTCIIMLVCQVLRQMRLKMVQEESERDAEQARDRQREMRMRREQEQQRNTQDPRDLVPLPSYTEALLMPKLDGSFNSLAGVGLGGDSEKKKKRKPRRRTRSSGDLYDDDRIPQRLRSRRKSRAEHPPPRETVPPAEHDQLISCSEENLPETCVIHLHESDF